MTKFKYIIVGLVVAALGATSLNRTSSKVRKDEVVEVDKSTVSTAAENPEPGITKTKVTRLDVNPEQILFLNTEVNNESVEILIAEIEKRSVDHDELYMVLASPGGSVFAGTRLISYMEAAKAKVYTITYSICASMCAQIHQHGYKRYMVDRSVLMFHSAAGEVGGTLPSMKSLLAFIDLETRKLDAYVADRAKTPRDQFGNLVIRDMWIAADDALTKNLSDGTVVIGVNQEDSDTFNMKKEFIKRNISVKSILNKTDPLSEIY